MHTYQEQQEQLFQKIEDGFKKGEAPSEIVTATDDFAHDKRMTLTGVTFLPDPIQHTIISKIINPLRDADDQQYFYAPKALHITIQNVRASNYPPNYTNDDKEKVKEVFRSIIPKHNNFTFELRGLFEMPTSFSVKAFSNEALKALVLELRQGLIKAGVPDDKKYGSDSIFFGNATVCRYTSSPNKDFKKIMSQLKNINIGTFNVDNIALITTNSGANPEHTTVLEEYSLSNP